MVIFARADRLAEDEDLIRSLINRIENAEEAINELKAKVEAVTKATAETANNERILSEWMNGEDNGTN